MTKMNSDHPHSGQTPSHKPAHQPPESPLADTVERPMPDALRSYHGIGKTPQTMLSRPNRMPTASATASSLPSESTGSGIEPELITGLDRLSLVRSIIHQDDRNFRQLLSQSVDVNAVDSNGFSPLHYAAAFGTAEMVDALIKSGANVNVRASDGSVPLHYASCDAHVLALVKAGADVNAIDTEGKTALESFTNVGNDVMEQLVNAMDPRIVAKTMDKHEQELHAVGSLLQETEASRQSHEGKSPVKQAPNAIDREGHAQRIRERQEAAAQKTHGATQTR